MDQSAVLSSAQQNREDTRVDTIHLDDFGSRVIPAYKPKVPAGQAERSGEGGNDGSIRPTVDGWSGDSDDQDTRLGVAVSAAYLGEARVWRDAHDHTCRTGRHHFKPALRRQRRRILSAYQAPRLRFVGSPKAQRGGESRSGESQRSATLPARTVDRPLNPPPMSPAWGVGGGDLLFWSASRNLAGRRRQQREVHMHGERHVEHYGFYCQPCNYEWLMSYEVRSDAQSGEPEFFYLYGLPASPPSLGRLCPTCWAPSNSGQRYTEPELASSRR